MGSVRTILLNSCLFLFSFDFPVIQSEYGRRSPGFPPNVDQYEVSGGNVSPIVFYPCLFLRIVAHADCHYGPKC